LIYVTCTFSSLEAHLDGGEFSFVISLNDNFTGGGTSFLPDKTDLQQPSLVTPDAGAKQHFNPPVGQMLMFPGQRKHIGEPVRSGVRYAEVAEHSHH
jgi:predicted 2-oxoglutarate/Fe(II)-dependent dioxygenase YbiX